mmetsp:Transcript_2015/g.2191  ORF Transcript_2015/g.2191 Transcript_2015/m.2191 type:complete len:207 (+) Transcript_2015:334-954(+)
MKQQQRRRRSTLLGVTILSSIFFVLSDFSSSLSSRYSFMFSPSNIKMLCLSTSYGIINAGTSDGSVGAGVTYAMTGHVTKVGTGFCEEVLSNNNNNNKKQTTATASAAGIAAHRTSAKGLLAFVVSATFANIACTIIARATSTTPTSNSDVGGFFLVQVSKLVGRLPFGTTLALLYSLLFRWYYVSSLSSSSSSSSSLSGNKKKHQ